MRPHVQADVPILHGTPQRLYARSHNAKDLPMVLQYILGRAMLLEHAYTGEVDAERLSLVVHMTSCCLRILHAVQNSSTVEAQSMQC